MSGGRDTPVRADPAGVVLAAGSGTRFGGAKQLAVAAGRPLLAHALAPLTAVGLPVVVVVGPPFGAAVRAARAHWIGTAGTVRVVDNPAPERGIGSSLATAAAAVGPRDLVVALADQPGIEEAWVRAVIAALAGGAPAARIVHSDGPGHPVGFAAQLHGALVALGSDSGGDLFAALGGTNIAVATPKPPDVDTPADLRGLGP